MSESTRSKVSGNGTPSTGLPKGKDKTLVGVSKEIVKEAQPSSSTSSAFSMSNSESFKTSSAKAAAFPGMIKPTAGSVLKSANPVFARSEENDETDPHKTTFSLTKSSTMGPPPSKLRSSTVKVTKKAETLAEKSSTTASTAKPTGKFSKPVGATVSASAPAPVQETHTPIPEIAMKFADESDIPQYVFGSIPDMEDIPLAEEAPDCGQVADKEKWDAIIPPEDMDDQSLGQSMLPSLTNMKNDDDEEEDEAANEEVEDEVMAEGKTEVNTEDTDMPDSSGPSIPLSGSGVIQLQPQQQLQLQTPQEKEMTKEKELEIAIANELEVLQESAVQAMNQAFNQSQESQFYESQRGEYKALVASAYVAIAIGLDSYVDELEFLEMKALSMAEDCLKMHISLEVQIAMEETA